MVNMNEQSNNIDRVSALEGCSSRSAFDDANPLLTLSEQKSISLHQIAAWPDSFSSVTGSMAKALAITNMPGASRVELLQSGALLYVEPLKYLILNAPCPSVDSEQAVTLDLSHSRTHVRLQGVHAAECLNRFVSLDLRDNSFPIGMAASTSFHHIGIILWRSQQGYELLLPRAFALSIWELLAETVPQFRLSKDDSIEDDSIKERAAQ